MSKASNRWIEERYYTLMGLECPADANFQQPQFNNEYVTDFLIPATFMASGKTREEFDFDKVKEVNAVSLKYLSECASASDINQVISIMYRTYKTPVWMLYLKDLVPLYVYDGLLSSSLQKAVNKYMETHKIAYATYSADSTDIMIVTDADGKPIAGYPDNCYIYTDEEVSHYDIKHGSCTVIDVCEKAWYSYDDFDKHLIDTMTYAVDGLMHSFPCPMYDESSGEVFNGSYTYLSKNKPPAEIAELMSLLPSALIEEYGDPVNALSAYVKGNPNQVTTPEAKSFIEKYNQLYAAKAPKIEASSAKVDIPTLVPHPCDTDETQSELEKMGYVTKDMDEVIKEYCREYNLSTDISVADLIRYMNDDTDSFMPKPFDKEAYAKEVIDGIDWDQVKADSIASIDRAEIVKEELSKIGVDSDTLARINIAISTNAQVDIHPTQYVDVFEEAGAVMLHGVREMLSKDASLENRQRVQDVIYAYLVIMMGETKKLDSVIQFTGYKRDSAQGQEAKDLISKAMEVLCKNP